MEDLLQDTKAALEKVMFITVFLRHYKETQRARPPREGGRKERRRGIREKKIWKEGGKKRW
jgi:hypothetical protein